MKGRGKWKTPLIVGGVGALVVLGIVVGLILPKAGQIRGKQKDLAQAKTVQSGLVLQLAELRTQRRRNAGWHLDSIRNSRLHSLGRLPGG